MAGEAEAPARPPPPIVGKVTHHNIELYWDEALKEANETMGRRGKGDSRMRITIQEQDRHGVWGNVYTGYGKSKIVEGLDPWTEYRYRLRFMNENGNSEWSPSISVSSTKEPLTGEHVHKAIMKQDVSDLKRALDSGVKPDIPDKYGFTPLMQAAQKGYIEMIEVLIEYGADVNFQNDSGKTSLMLAAYSGKLQAAKELRYHKADYAIQDRGGSTALHWAMDGGNVELLDFFIEDKANIECTDYNGWTPLLRIAAVTGNANVAGTLVRAGAKINTKDKDGKTALMMAVVNGHHALVTLLLQKNVDISIENDYNSTAYDMAKSMGRLTVIRTFEDYMTEQKIKFIPS